MRELGFAWIIQNHSLRSVVGFQRESVLISFGPDKAAEVQFDCEFKKDAELFRAAAIAAILAVQGASE